MKIKSIHIKYFRSIYNKRIDLGDFNIFVGLNDSGKSNILKALNLFFNNETGWKEKFSFNNDFNVNRNKEFEDDSRLKEAKEISIKITFEDDGIAKPVWHKKWRTSGLVFNEKYDQNTRKDNRNPNTGFIRYSKTPTKLNKIQYFYVPALKGPDYISFLIGQLSSVLSERASSDIRTAAEGFEENLSGHLDDLTKLIQDELSLESQLKLPTNLIGIFENMEFSDQRGVGLSHRGDGMRTRHIPILLHKIAKLHNLLREKRELYDHFIWGYEEPENNVELTACYKMANSFYKVYSSQYQVLLTTHSPAFYGLPERNIPEWVQGENKTYRYFANIKDGNSEYTQLSNEELNPFFILPAITEIMEKELLEKQNLQEELLNLQQNAEYFNKPTIFVEGDTDKIIITKAIEIFYPELIELIHIRSPDGAENGGGGNFVKDHLIIWEYKQKHLPENERKKSIGIFDHDEGGLNALKSFKATCQNPTYSKNITYKYNHRIDNHFRKLRDSDLDYNLSYQLENLYSPSLWQEACNNNWIEKTDHNFGGPIGAGFLSEAVRDKLKQINLDNNLELYFTHKFKHFSKLNVANFINHSNLNQAKDFLYLFEEILYSTFKKMEIIIE